MIRERGKPGMPPISVAVHDSNRNACTSSESRDDENYLISQFADDTTLAIKNTKGSLDRTFQTFKEFAKISGLKINVDETEILMMGASTMWDIPQRYRKIIKDTVNILGIKLSTSGKQQLQSHSGTDERNNENM